MFHVFCRETNPFVIDAYLMFQDIVLLIGADQPFFMTGIGEMTRTFGLELLESLLTKFPSVFETHDQVSLFTVGAQFRQFRSNFSKEGFRFEV